MMLRPAVLQTHCSARALPRGSCHTFNRPSLKVLSSNAGRIMHMIDQNSLSQDEHWFAIKGSLDEAAYEIFGGHATVQKHGSVGKGTGVQDASDYDFMVRLDDTIDTVTKKQRMTFWNAADSNLRSRGVQYEPRISEIRIQLREGTHYGIPIADTDVVFQRYNNHPGLRLPNSRGMDQCHNARYVVRFFKNLPKTYTNLTPLKSMHLEDMTKLAAEHLVCQRGWAHDEVANGADGFAALLDAVLRAVADPGCQLAQLGEFQADLEAALDADNDDQLKRRLIEWQRMAHDVLHAIIAF